MEAEHPFYRVERVRQGKWSVRATAFLRRTDSGEIAEQVTVRADDASAAALALSRAVAARLSELERPRDWGRSPRPQQCIDAYLALRERQHADHLRLEEATPDARATIREQAEAADTISMA